MTINTSRRYVSNNELASRHILVSGRATVSVPYMSASYSHNIGGVDRFDRKLASWKRVVKSKKWWFRIFILFIHAIKLNAFAVYQQILKERGDPCKLTVEDFIEQLVAEGIGNNKFRARSSTRSATES